MKKSLTDLALKDKRVLMRVDFNVPQNPDGSITDDTRIRASLPSIRYVLNHGGRLILLSHLGRPEGKSDPQYSLAPIAKRLSELLGQAVPLLPKPQNVPICLLENLRFHIGEEHPDQDPSFARQLASYGDCYVNDAFGTAHRAHASTTSLPSLFPGEAAAGFLMTQELSFLSLLLENPKRPFYAILGGAKVSSKIGIIQALLPRVDGLFIGGLMAIAFFNESNRLPLDKIHLPVDFRIQEGSTDQIVTQIPSPSSLVDIGPKTLETWAPLLQSAATIFWNGPMGQFENPRFATGTNGLAKILSTLHATTIVGGGDSVLAVQRSGFAPHFSHLSTGGGASLEFLEKGHLPGVDALSDK